VTVRFASERGTVVVADGHLNTSLWVARSLRRAGYRVIAAASGTSAAGALASSSVARAVRVPSGERGAAEIVSLARREGAVAVLAHYEQTLLALHRAVGGEPPVIAGAAPGHLELCARKWGVLEKAQQVGVRIPDTRVVDRGASSEELRDLVRSLVARHGWPLFAKCDTELGVPPGKDSRYVVVRDEADLTRLAAFVRARGRVLLQERIAGTGCGIAGLFVLGIPACVGGHVRLREAYATGGVSTFCESRVVEGALHSARTLMEALRWTGVAMIEFKIPASGPPVLMEVNPRLWGTLPLYVLAGADVPLAALEYALHGRIPPPARPFEEGKRMRFLLSDLVAIRRQYSGLRRARELAIALAETPWVVPEATFSVRDPMPFLVDVGEQASASLRRLFALRAPARP
jgi:hypothetical protein